MNAGNEIEAHRKGVTDKNTNKSTNVYFVVLLGLGMAVRGLFTAWSFVLVTGFWQSLGALLIMASAYLCLVLCLAEMTSAMPFSGGNYGLARVTLGNFPAYCIFFSESMEYILYVSFSVGAIAQMITILAETDMKFRPAYFVGVYLSIIAIHSSPKKIYWNINALLATFVMAMIVIYCLGAAPAHGDFDRNVIRQDPKSSEHDSSLFFQLLPNSAYFFTGLEVLPFACGEVKAASKNIPKALYMTFCIALVASICVLFSATSVSGIDALKFEFVPLNHGFSLLFGIPADRCTVFPLIATFTGVLGYSFAYSRILAAAEKSKLVLTLVKPIFKSTSPMFRPMLLGSALGFAALMWKTMTDQNDRFFENAAFICAFLSYIGIFVTYIQYKRNYYTLAKGYVNRLGIYGAVWGILIFSAALISIVGFQKDDGRAVYLVLVLFALFVAFYFLRARRLQVHNSEEQAIMFIAYVMKANQIKRQRVRTAGSAGGKTNSSNHISSVSKGRQSRKTDATKSTALILNEGDRSNNTEENALTTGNRNDPGDTELFIAANTLDLESNGGIAASSAGFGTNPPLSSDKRGKTASDKFLGGFSIRNVLSASPYARISPFSSSGGGGSTLNSTRSANSSDGSSASEASEQRRILENYMSAMPESFVPANLEFDGDILARYFTALDEFNAIRLRSTTADKQPNRRSIDASVSASIESPGKHERREEEQDEVLSVGSAPLPTAGSREEPTLLVNGSNKNTNAVSLVLRMNSNSRSSKTFGT